MHFLTTVYNSKSVLKRFIKYVDYVIWKENLAKFVFFSKRTQLCLSSLSQSAWFSSAKNSQAEVPDGKWYVQTIPVGEIFLFKLSCVHHTFVRSRADPF